MRTTVIRIAMAVALTAIGAACNKSFLTKHPVAIAGATLTDSAGLTVATASLWQEAGGLVHVDVETVCAAASCSTFSPGDHGIHFHAVGSCVAASSTVFSSAGGHFNPLGKQHGLNNTAGPHAGDAPNFTIDANGKGKASFTTDRVTLTSGATFTAGCGRIVHRHPRRRRRPDDPAVRQQRRARRVRNRENGSLIPPGERQAGYCRERFRS